KLMLQWPLRMGDHLVSKVLALLIAWLIALIPFAIAIALWLAYGGHLYAPETINLLAGYTLYFVLTASVAMAAAALMPGAANAAVAILGLTIGTWALDFLATGRGGLVQRLASFTPAAALRVFERGLMRKDLVLALLALSVLALFIAGRTAGERPATEEIVIETIEKLWSGGRPRPPKQDAPDDGTFSSRRPGAAAAPQYPGYPLAKRARGAAWIFYALWPLAVITAWRLRSRRTG